MNAAIDRLRQRLFHGNKLITRDNETSASLMNSATSTASRASLCERVRRKRSMCLNGIVFMLRCESNSKIPASQKSCFSRRGSAQNLSRRSISYLQQALRQQVAEER